jgi:hypothetical protein
VVNLQVSRKPRCAGSMQVPGREGAEADEEVQHSLARASDGNVSTVTGR